MECAAMDPGLWRGCGSHGPDARVHDGARVEFVAAARLLRAASLLAGDEPRAHRDVHAREREPGELAVQLAAHLRPRRTPGDGRARLLLGDGDRARLHGDHTRWLSLLYQRTRAHARLRACTRSGMAACPRDPALRRPRGHPDRTRTRGLLH